RLGCQKACVLPENPASYRVVRTKSYLFNKAVWLVILVVLAIDQIAQSGLNSLKVIYFSA
ncbi:TPA: hypothetical protein ACIAMC_005263, partial [Salmonella enterica subsp. enterica serovar Westhampton]